MKHMVEKGKIVVKKWVFRGKKGSSVKCVDGYHVMHIVLM